ncbi:iron ABC transporter permease [Curvibacter sp. APW13]|uniref:ABC transporter permease n=1 Tax=Curvibacter sp. APW13 TaxID=3077236 RepID=UPI0028DDCA38|nr:iron ABC transporter permease [Curvibacter sp. APW13]MDT8989714.1 iron ABC transporter permease [Curvibacter sp. APW13]
MIAPTAPIRRPLAPGGSLRGTAVLLWLLGAGLALPLLAIAASWLQLDAAGWQTLRDLGDTVLPRYALTSLWLCLGVGLGVAVVGTGAAVAVTVFDFRGRRGFEWLLLLPLAVPPYVVAYGYTDFLQYAGPVQTALRTLLGREGAMLPEVRSLGGAIWVLTFTLYPYVYLLARTALAERATSLLEAARLLGASGTRTLWQVALPLARPAITAGVALALMETLADYGVVSYFGVQSFTAGIYKAWLVFDDRYAAAQLATVLLLCVAAFLAWEQRAQQRLRFSTRQGGPGARSGHAVRLHGRRALLAWLVCGLPVVAGFVAPVLFMLRPLLGEWTTLPWAPFASWALNSLRLAALTAVLASGVALGLGLLVRVQPSGSGPWLARIVGLGYAVPGAVVVVGLLLPLGWVQAWWPTSPLGALLTATSFGLVWAYLVRFVSVALQSVHSGYSRVPRSLDESARLLGCTGWALLWRVHAPLLRRPLAAALLLVFVDVMKELPATLVLRPFNSDTLAVMAYQLARDERLGEAALPALALVLVGLVPVILLSRTLRRPA